MTTQQNEREFLDSLSLEARSAVSPLKHLKGRLASIGHKEVPSGFSDGNNRNQLLLTLQLDNVVVFESTTPYPWKTAELVFTHGSQVWGILGTSLTRHLGPGAKLGDAINKVLTIKMTPGHPVRRRASATAPWEDTKIEAFEVIAIDGAVGGAGQNTALPSISTDDILTLLADGSTAEIFEGRIYQDARVKTNTTLLAQISQVGVMPILEGLLQAGLLAKDEGGVYHKAPSAEAQSET